MLSAAAKPLIWPCVIYTFASIATPNSVRFLSIQFNSIRSIDSGLSSHHTHTHTQTHLIFTFRLEQKFAMQILCKKHPWSWGGASFNFQWTRIDMQVIFSIRWTPILFCSLKAYRLISFRFLWLKKPFLDIYLCLIFCIFHYFGGDVIVFLVFWYRTSIFLKYEKIRSKPIYAIFHWIEQPLND